MLALAFGLEHPRRFLQHYRLQLLVFLQLRKQCVGRLDLPFFDITEQVGDFACYVRRKGVGVEHVESVFGAVGLGVGKVGQRLHGVPHGVCAEVERKAVVAFVGGGVGYGVEIQGLLRFSFHCDGKCLCHKHFAVEHRHQSLLRIAEIVRVGGETERQEAEVVFGGHLPSYLLATAGHNLLHGNVGGREQQVYGLHGGGVEDFESGGGCNGLVAGVDDVGHKPQRVAGVHIARQVGHYHHGFRRGESVFPATRLKSFVVGKEHKTPACEGVGHGETEGGAAVVVGAQVGEEESRFVEILAHGGFGGLGS